MPSLTDAKLQIYGPHLTTWNTLWITGACGQWINWIGTIVGNFSIWIICRCE